METPRNALVKKKNQDFPRIKSSKTEMLLNWLIAQLYEGSSEPSMLIPTVEIFS